ncbi:glutathione hydrolase 1 proenzyme-like [Hydractinia symbiolongicarpus]|uniref:glutathione hydrolase 1 proenzyme-like n=1 Tax=Hydractinia symbiolongicarpus TaxID=13093 RepID=UPI002550CDD0|nr:glutathione hydrolase 1 proenzyme-like [Hydractinia symbiolongicarpus]
MDKKNITIVLLVVIVVIVAAITLGVTVNKGDDDDGNSSAVKATSSTAITTSSTVGTTSSTDNTTSSTVGTTSSTNNTTSSTVNSTSSTDSTASSTVSTTSSTESTTSSTDSTTSSTDSATSSTVGTTSSADSTTSSSSTDSTTSSTMSTTGSTAKDYYTNGAVAADVKNCSDVGLEMLKAGGHAVDATIATLICVGVVNLHSSGVGGGGFMTLYDKAKKKTVVFDYRETGPTGMHADSYAHDENAAKVGGLAVGVPGEIRGLKMVHDRYGKLPWAKLFEPAIKMAEEGTRIGKHMASKMSSSSTKAAILADPGLREILVKENNMLKEEGDIIVNKKLANTLRILKDNPEDLYTGNISKSFLRDVKNYSGIMTADDMKNYEVLEKVPIKTTLNGLTLHTTPLPGGGSVLIHILNMVKGYNFNASYLDTVDEKVLTYHRIVESFKFSYSKRPHLGDPDKVPAENKTEFDKVKEGIISQDLADMNRMKVNDTSTQENSYYDPFFTTTENHGTTHVSVIDKDGNAVAATDTINFSFGAKFRSMETGIIYNNELADFFLNSTYGDTYPTPFYNAPGAGRRPLSSTCPSILVDKDGNVVMVVGGSGGTRITLSTAWVIIKKLMFSYNLTSAVEDARPQHAFFPEYIRNEIGYLLSDDIVEGLEKKNHKILKSSLNAIVQAIYVEGEKIYAKSDPRKEGVAAGY